MKALTQKWADQFKYNLLNGYCYTCKTLGLIRWFKKTGQYQHVQCGSYEARVFDRELLTHVKI